MTAVLPGFGSTGFGSTDLGAGEARPPLALPTPRRPHGLLARPTSPVGRTSQTPTSPLQRLEARTGHPLPDLGQCTDVELSALTALLLAETHRRTTRWLETSP